MLRWHFLILAFLISAQVNATVHSYFNNNPRSSYTDPYRQTYRAGDNFEQIIVDQIISARKSVYLAVQELRLPLIAQALIEQKKKGVDVRIVLENNYNFTVLDQGDPTSSSEHDENKLAELRAFIDLNRNGSFEKKELETRDAIYMLRKAKIPVMDDTFDDSMGSGLMHHKFVIVDGKRTIVSTANFTMSCIHGDVLEKKSKGNANSLILVESVEFAQVFSNEFLELWGDGKVGRFGLKKSYRGVQTVVVDGKKLTVQFSPTSKSFNYSLTVNGLIARYIGQARKSVDAALFVFSDQRLSNVMEKAQTQGADISVLIEPKFAFRDYSELLDMFGLKMLNEKCEYEPDNHPWSDPVQEAGIALLPRGDVLHHKFAVVDEKVVIMGSQNWSDAANYINDENIVIIEDTAISKAFGQEYERLKMSSLLGPTQSRLEEIEERERECSSLAYRL